MCPLRADRTIGELLPPEEAAGSGCAGYGPKAGIPTRVAGRHEPSRPGSCDQALPVAMTLTPKRARAEDCAQAESTLRAPARRDRPGFLASSEPSTRLQSKGISHVEHLTG